jgi:hypothetical protein
MLITLAGLATGIGFAQSSAVPDKIDGEASKRFSVKILHAHALPIAAPVVDEQERRYFAILRSAAKSSTLDEGFLSSKGSTGRSLKFAEAGEPLDLGWGIGDLSTFRLALGIPVCAIIGNDWLSRFSIEFDLDSGVMAAFPINGGGNPSDRFNEKESLTNDPASPPSRFFNLAGFAVNAVLDTGADDEFVIPTAGFERLLRDGTLDNVQSFQSGGVNGVHEIRVGVLTSSAATAALPLKTFVSETKANVASVGMGLLQHRNFFIDRHSNSLWTRARQVPVPKNDGFTEIGVALVFPPNAGPTVYQVVDGSPAGEAGLSTGYVVTRLSGLPAEEINRYTAERALSKAATDRSPVEILVSKQGRVERLTLLPPAAAKR